MGNKRGGKKEANNQNTPFELNHSIPYAKTAGTSFCPFPWTDVLISHQEKNENLMTNSKV